ncbi:5,6-dimethylbenzimidazole synthase [Rhodococcoides corynebacterioides]|uniref:5,6-dimethylbenzimidazole synthase n=1 Tax=Rhodococcoides corynebacterioides TaxID=53972 RepID=A0ABS7P837_9NOCA|nr:5,6-dimethylbenzimidazole synthase [Rhodococcus corynebacterioides]MBY6368579.1 5,6-dimethylbenzimidazole synthase [Rhodococcus corynebacterioides]MBY6409666.1 5,6-dimethylbenzimidazole synthase [Rhodococcus corynebacterioides]
MDVTEAIARRRDVRREFTGDLVDDDVLRRLLGAAHRAPSVGNTQPWDFVVVRERATLRRFAEHVASCRADFAASLPPERAATFDPIRIEGIETSGTGVVVTYDDARGGDHVLGRATVRDTGLLSVALAIENLWLAATAEGIGVGWVSFYDEAFLSELVGVDGTGVRPVAWLCVGPVTALPDVPDLERFGWRSRRPLDDAVHWERW